MLKLRESLVEAAVAVLMDNIDVSELVKELDVSISELEKSRTNNLEKKAGSFDAIFDLLMKFKMLQSPTGCVTLTQDNFRMAHFAKRSTVSLVGYGLPGVPVKTAFEQIVGDLWTYPVEDKSSTGPDRKSVV